MEPISRFANAWMPIFAIHMLELSAFILLVWAMDRFVRLDTRLRYSLWLLALVKVFVPPLFSLPAPLPVPEALPEQISFQPLISGPPSQAVGKAGSLSLSVLPLGVWVVSALLLAGITAYQNAALRRRLRDASPVSIPAAIFTTHHSPLTTHLQVFSVGTISAPVLVGFRRPRLYLPEDWATWPESQLRGILAHELAHLRSHDRYVLVLQTLALILFGLNPLVWVMYTRLTYLRELRCDEAAIEEAGIHPVDYSKLLYSFVQKQVRRPLTAMTGTYFSENHHAILGRFQHVLNLQEADMKSRRRWHYAAPVLLGLAILPLSIQGVEQHSNPPETTNLAHLNVRLKAESGDLITVERSPGLVQLPKPNYPEAARKDSLEGAVYLNVLVGKDGRAKQVEVVAGPEIFHQAAVDAAKQTVWEPARYKGEPVSVWATFPIWFILKKGISPKPDAFIPVDQQPTPLIMPRPTYPEAARRDSLKGVVYLRILVSKDGRAEQVEAIQRGAPFKGEELFKQAAIDAAKETVWAPALYKGEPVSVWVAYPIRFTLK